MIRVFLVEDQAIVRQGLRSLLDLVDDIEVVGEAADGETAVASIPEAAPDVVLLDLRMPQLDGLGVLDRLGSTNQLPPTLILTTFDDDSSLLAGQEPHLERPLEARGPRPDARRAQSRRARPHQLIRTLW